LRCEAFDGIAVEGDDFRHVGDILLRVTPRRACRGIKPF
jgi:hypothetical protein